MRLASSPRPGPQRLVHIQYLRGIAAMMVVVHHVLRALADSVPALARADLGLPGVLIFFVISGFVMMHACRDEPPATFALRRIIRVVPLYWVMTLVYFAILLRADLARGIGLDRAADLLPSLLFLPHWHFGVPDRIWPILVPGWTLNYEMFFFFLFFVGIAFGSVRAVVIALLLALVALGAAVDFADPRLITWTHPYLLLFLAGMLLALAWPRIDFARVAALLPVGLGLVILAALNGMPGAAVLPAFCLGAVLTVAGTLGVQARRPGLEIRPLAALGDASYSIYLSHTIALIFVIKGLAVLPLSGWAQTVVTGLLAVGILTAVGLAVYRWIERPMLRAMRRRLETRATGGPPAAPPVVPPKECHEPDPRHPETHRRHDHGGTEPAMPVRPLPVRDRPHALRIHGAVQHPVLAPRRVGLWRGAHPL